MTIDTMDALYMKRAIDLAERARGRTWPNPLVGCVVVKDGTVIAEGYHHYFGGDHAERDALNKLALGDAEGATLYVTLEPCCHTGKTPPCCDLILEHKVARVVAGSLDPNPLVSGRGLQVLRDGGVEVTVGVLEEACDQQNLFFRHHMITGMPYVAQKYAMTLDGKIATGNGDSKWVSGPASREHVQLLRKSYASILVGIGTVLADDPLLTCRIDAKSPCIRVICDHQLRLPMTSQIVQTAGEVRTIVVCGAAAPTSREDELKTAGLEVWRMGERIVLRQLFRRMAEDGINSVLIEGGGSVHGSVLEEGLADRLYVYIAPKLVGGETAKSPVGGPGIPLMKDALRLVDIRLERLGEDILLEGVPADRTLEAQ